MISDAYSFVVVRVRGVKWATAVRLEDAPCPHCFRCGAQLFLDRARLAPGDEQFPFVWICDRCESPADRSVIAGDEPERDDDPRDGA